MFLFEDLAHHRPAVFIGEAKDAQKVTCAPLARPPPFALEPACRCEINSSGLAQQAEGIDPGIKPADALVLALVAGPFAAFLIRVQTDGAAVNFAPHPHQFAFDMIEHFSERFRSHQVGVARVRRAVGVELEFELRPLAGLAMVQIRQRRHIKPPRVLIAPLPELLPLWQNLPPRGAVLELAAQIDIENPPPAPGARRRIFSARRPDAARR
jgi:hypothetical protein